MEDDFLSGDDDHISGKGESISGRMMFLFVLRDEDETTSSWNGG